MAELGDQPLAATSQDVVVDIEPTSQHGAPFDLVTVTTSAVVDGRIVRLRERREVAADDGRFQLTLNVPIRGTVLAKDPATNEARWSVLVLLPRATGDYEVDVQFNGEVEGELLTPAGENTRRVIAWHGVQDPPIAVVWQYIRP